MTLTLYSHWRATAPYRVRIGLALKGVAYRAIGARTDIDFARLRQ